MEIPKVWSDFPVLIGQEELKGKELAICVLNVTFCNCFYLNTEIRIEGPLRSETITSNATLPLAAPFQTAAVSACWSAFHISL